MRLNPPIKSHSGSLFLPIERINGEKKKKKKEKGRRREGGRKANNKSLGREGAEEGGRKDVKPHAWGVFGEERWRHLGRKRQRSGGKACAERVSSGGGGVRKKRRGAGEGRMERGRGEKEGGGRPGIDRLKKGWIFLPLGGGPAALEGRVPDSITTKPTSDLRERNRSTEDLLSLLLFPPPGDSSFSFLLPSPLFSGDDRG